MAPKKVDKRSEKGVLKSEEKKKVKVAEDKTFGLKNKNKSKAVQKFIKGVHQQVKPAPSKAAADAEFLQKEQSKKQKQQEVLLQSLFKGTENVKTIAAYKTDPKTIREEQKIDIYVDQRTKPMEEWNLDKLNEVINSKHAEQNASCTDIICKHFLDAVEKKQYGWFWSCPGGGDSCKYRHCLPPGYVLKCEAPVEDEEEEELLEEIIERERSALPDGGTMVTLETFLVWKTQKEKQKAEAERKSLIEASRDKTNAGMSGRDLFSYDPTLFIDGDEVSIESDYDDSSEQESDSGDDESLDDIEAVCSNDSPDNPAPVDSSSGSPSSQTKSTNLNTTGEGIAALNVKRADLFLEEDVPDFDELDGM